MNILWITIPVSLLLGLGFIGAFIWATYSDQWTDLETPARQILNDDSKHNSDSQKGS